MPRRSRLLVPSKIRVLKRRLIFIPFSLWKLPTGITTSELVTSGRSVQIGGLVGVHSSAAIAGSDNTAIAMIAGNSLRMREGLLTAKAIIETQAGCAWR